MWTQNLVLNCRDFFPRYTLSTLGRHFNGRIYSVPLDVVCCVAGERLVHLITHADGFFSSFCVCLFVCLCVCFSTWYLKSRCSWDHQTWRRNVPPWVLEAQLFWIQKVKGQRSRSRTTKTLPAWVFALLWVLASSCVIVFVCTDYDDVRKPA